MHMVAYPLFITMGYMTLLQNDVIKFPMMLLLNHPQQLTREKIVPTTANRMDEARVDIHARGFWRQRQGAFLMLVCFT